MCKFNPKNDSRRIDPCMKNFVEYLSDYLPHEVVACCCGHGKYPMSIVVENYNRSSGARIFFEIFSNKIIPHQKKFYKKDKQGYYFIPEVSKEK